MVAWATHADGKWLARGSLLSAFQTRIFDSPMGLFWWKLPGQGNLAFCRCCPRASFALWLKAISTNSLAEGHLHKINFLADLQFSRLYKDFLVSSRPPSKKGGGDVPPAWVLLWPLRWTSIEGFKPLLGMHGTWQWCSPATFCENFFVTNSHSICLAESSLNNWSSVYIKSAGWYNFFVFSYSPPLPSFCVPFRVETVCWVELICSHCCYCVPCLSSLHHTC